MKKLIVFLAVVALIIGCGSGGNEAPTSTTTTQKKETVAAVDGEKVYKQYCVTCHGLYGDMGASGAANLQESVLEKEERVAVITNGRNVMTGFKALLSEEKINAVAEYTFTLKEQ